MLNIVSRSLLTDGVTGPAKVVRNLIKGLQEIGYPHQLNRRLDSIRRLWIHDDKAALTMTGHLPPEVHVVAGPNLFVVPRQIPASMDLRKAVMLFPAAWVKDFWLQAGYTSGPMEVWPCGIDTANFRPSPKERDLVLIYFKSRFPDELEAAEKLMHSRGIKTITIRYGQYREVQFKDYLSRAKYLLWIGQPESQGIALQEALASNVPVLVWEVADFGHWENRASGYEIFTPEELKFIGCQSAPYFDARCGFQFSNVEELGHLADEMESNWQQFRPREFILERLNTAGQARALLAIYENHFGMRPSDSGLRIHDPGPWRNAKLPYSAILKLRATAKKARELWKSF